MRKIQRFKNGSNIKNAASIVISCFLHSHGNTRARIEHGGVALTVIVLEFLAILLLGQKISKVE